MALYRIDTKYFEVVNTDDDALTLPDRPAEGSLFGHEGGRQ